MTGHTAVGDRVLLQVGFRTAGVRLRRLARNGMLEWACEVAYGEGITVLIELAGPAAGLTRLASACLADLTETGDRAHIALQWDAIDADGTLFTALLADLMLVPAGEQASVLSLAGAYWPPPGLTGAVRLASLYPERYSRHSRHTVPPASNWLVCFIMKQEVQRFSRARLQPQ